MTDALKFKFIFCSVFGGVEMKINAECVQKMSINRFSHTDKTSLKTDDELRAASAHHNS